MLSIFDIRRDNLRRIFKERGGSSEVAKLLGYTSGSFMAQLAGPNPTRKLTDKNARRFEEMLGLPQGWMDTTESGQRAGMQSPLAEAPNREMAAAITEVIRLVGSVAQEEAVDMPPARFADVAAIAVQDALEHGGVARESHIRSVVRLLKH